MFLSGFLGKAALGARHLGRKCLPARFLCFPTRTTLRHHRRLWGTPPPHPAGVCPAPGPAAGAGTWWRQPAWGLVVGFPSPFCCLKTRAMEAAPRRLFLGAGGVVASSVGWLLQGDGMAR